MAVSISELPNFIQEKIADIVKVEAIQQIIAYGYPSGNTEVSVFWHSEDNENCLKIFSY